MIKNSVASLANVSVTAANAQVVKDKNDTMIWRAQKFSEIFCVLSAAGLLPANSDTVRAESPKLFMLGKPPSPKNFNIKL